MAIDQISRLMTPQELAMIGSGVSFNVEGRDWYRPTGVTSGEIPLEQVIEERQTRAWIDGGFILAGILGRPDLGIKLQVLDSKTGETADDPVVGVHDTETDTYLENPEFTKNLFLTFEEKGIKLHLREGTSRAVEKSGSSKEISA